MKKIFGGVMALLLSASLLAQPIKDPQKNLTNIGVSGLGVYDVCLLPTYSSATDVTVSPHLMIFTGSFGFRKTLIGFNDHSALGLTLEPSIGLSYTPIIDVRTDIPIMIGINKGAAATSRSISTRGFAWNVGVNFQNGPYLNILTYAEDGVNEAIKPRFMVCTSLHYRQWKSRFNSDGVCREVELFFATDLVSRGESFSGEPLVLDIPMRLALYFRRFLNY